MRKILVVAAREFRAMVGTKAFLFSVAMMPILMFGSILAINLMDRTDTIDDRRIAVVDHTGRLFDRLKAAADAHNALLDQATSAGEGPQGTASRVFRDDRYLLSKIPPEAFDDELRLQFSDQIRRNELYAFVEIPKDVLPDSLDASPGTATFVAPDSVLSSARRWMGTVLNQLITADRLGQAGIDAEIVRRASQEVSLQSGGLYSKDERGGVTAAAQKNEMTAIFLPMSCMMLMFMVIFMAAQPMLESVLEEKSSRIVEVLLGSLNPTQLMLGKLIGTVAGSLTIFGVYLAGSLAVARYQEVTIDLSWQIVPWFIVFQILGVLFFAAIFLAVGAAVSQLKEAQSMLLPVWLMLMIPMFVWFQIVREPNGPLAFGLTFFPPATPSVLVLRLATGATVPLWQILASLALLIAATFLCTWLAGRIFRVGILWQGKTPKISDLIRWGFHPGH